jgi:DNA-binding PadR family transcriptional regulator
MHPYFTAARRGFPQPGRPFDGRSPGGFGPWGFPGHGPRGFGGPGPRARRGDVRSALLGLLADGPSNGYGPIKAIGERTGGVWQPSPGSVYPALSQLEDEGLVRAEETEGRRAFALTDAGRAYVTEHEDEIGAPWEAIADAAPSGEFELRDLARQFFIAVAQVSHAGTETQVQEAKAILADARKRLYRILAEED